MSLPSLDLRRRSNLYSTNNQIQNIKFKKKTKNTGIDFMKLFTLLKYRELCRLDGHFILLRGKDVPG